MTNNFKRVIVVGVAVVLMSAGIWYLEATKTADNQLRSNVQQVSSPGSSQAPDFTGISQWLNSDPLTMESLRGKVVLVDFWTYSCINCIRTLPHVTSWYERYRDQGLVVVGVHTPEFAFEKDASNVARALGQNNITYPVALDNDYGTWNAYRNRYWPAHYLIDQEGQLVYTHFGEGKYAEMEAMIRKLLSITADGSIQTGDERREVRTPEIYFGLDRLEHVDSSQVPNRTSSEYTPVLSLKPNTFALGGQWVFDSERAQSRETNGTIMLSFYAADVHMVARAAEPVEVTVRIDGEEVRRVTVHESDLYTLFEGDEAGQHLLELEIDGVGFEIFTFTFG